MKIPILRVIREQNDEAFEIRVRDAYVQGYRMASTQVILNDQSNGYLFHYVAVMVYPNLLATIDNSFIS